MACLGTQLFISSNKFERQQAVAVVKAAGADRPFERDFPLLFRARGDLDEQFASHQRIIFSNHFLYGQHYRPEHAPLPIIAQCSV